MTYHFLAIFLPLSLPSRSSMIHPTAGQHLGQVHRSVGQRSHQGLDVDQFHRHAVIALGQDESGIVAGV